MTDQDTPVHDNDEKKLSVEEFVELAFDTLRVEGKLGLHIVFSGFNQGFREYFPELDPREELKKLVDAGKIVLRPAFRGAVIYRPEEAPEILKSQTKGSSLKKMGL